MRRAGPEAADARAVGRRAVGRRARYRRAPRRVVFAVAALTSIVLLTAPVVGGQAARASAYRAEPAPIVGVHAVAAGTDRIRVTWSRVRGATKVAVTAGSDSIDTVNRFTTGWLKPSTRSVVLTIPKRLRVKLGARSGQPVFVKVIASNSLAKHPAEELFFDASTAFRLSPPGTWSMAGAPKPARDLSRLEVGELNVQSAASSAGFTPANRWDARLPRIVKTIEASHPDLLATAELATQLVAPCPQGNHPAAHQSCVGETQYTQLANALAAGSTPYALATADAYQAVHAEMARDGRRWDGAVTDGAHLFYNPARMTLLEHGYISPALDLKMSDWTPKLGDRWSSWAEFRLTDGSKRAFLAVATHFPVGRTADVIAIRHEESVRLSAYLDRLAKGLPIVFAGDLNADSVRDPRPASTTFIDDGYLDAGATPNRAGIRWSTSNATNGSGGADPGYPRLAIEHAYPTSRIDYIMVKGRAATFGYENIVRVAGTRFLPGWQGTDHNLQLARLGLGNRTRAR